MKNFLPIIALAFMVMRGLKSMGWKTPEKGLKYEPEFKMAEMYYNIPKGLLSRMAYQESRYNPFAVSAAGAKGLMQFMPKTWAEWKTGDYDILDPKAQIAAAAKYMRWLYSRTNSWTLALAAYNWGIGNLEKKGFQSAPKETRVYVAEISKDVGIA